MPLKETIELLKADGHELIPWTPLDFEQTFLIFSNFVFADKGYYFNKSMRFEKIDKAIEMNNRVFKTPIFIR